MGKDDCKSEGICKIREKTHKENQKNLLGMFGIYAEEVKTGA